MDLRFLLLGVSLLVISTTTQAKDIYKCQVNGTVKFTEEKCDSNSKPIQLKGLAAPLEPYDLKRLESMDNRTRIKTIKNRIALRQKRIKTYRKRMQDEITVLKMRADAKDKRRDKKSSTNSSIRKTDVGTQVNTIADNFDGKGTTAEQINSVVFHYQTLIKDEQFQIDLLVQELKT